MANANLCWATVIILFLGPPVAPADDADPIAHWPLNGDLRDVGPFGLQTINHGVRLDVPGRPDAPTPAATFDGQGSYITVDAGRSPPLGTGDFSIALWIYTDGAFDDDLGDLISQYDPVRRTGFQLSLRNNTGVTSCQANSRQLQFGIDAGTEPTWRDEGRPGNAILAFGLAVHDGELYAGTCEPGKDDAGHVYRYGESGRWLDLGAPDRANAVSALASYRGSLYVATSKYRLAGSALPESENPHPGGRVFRLAENGHWTEVGCLSPEHEAIGGMVVYLGKLYVSSLYRPAGFFRYERDGQWTSLPTPSGLRVEALGVFNGGLWASSYDGAHVVRFDGESWKNFGQVGDNTQTYSFAIYRGQLHVGTWPSGKVYRLGDGDTWEDLGQLGEEREVMGMIVHNGKLYGGTLPLGEVFRHDLAQTWTKIARLDHTLDVKYRRVWTMAQFQGRLFASTLPSGHIHSMEAGKCVTYDRELPAGWRHVAAVRASNRLRLFVDGEPVAESTPFDDSRFDLTTQAPLLLGKGSGDFFKGRMRDVRLDHSALSQSALKKLAER